jgi:hypothetical protein
MTFWLRTGRALAVVASIRSGRTLLLLHPARLKLKEPGVHGITASQAVGVSRTDVAYQMVLPGLRLGLSVFWSHGQLFTYITGMGLQEAGPLDGNRSTDV